MAKRSQTVFQILLGLCLCLFIISAAVSVTLQFRPLYYLDIRLLDIPGLSGLDEAVIQENYDALIAYNSLFSHGPLALPSLVMSESGRIHFEEVKVIFDLFGWMAIISFLLSAAGILYSRRQKGYLYLKTAALLSVILPVLLGVLVAINWDFAFVAFHKLVFNNDYWIFDPVTDPVITILPDAFFLHCAVLILALVISGSILCAVLYRRQKKKYT